LGNTPGQEEPASFEHGTGRVVGVRIRPASKEADYRLATLRADGRDAAIVIGVFTTLTLPFVYNDLFWPGPAGRLGVLLAARVVYLVTGYLAVWIGLRGRRPSALDWSVLVHWVTGAAFTVVLQSTRPADYYLPVMANAIAVLLVWAVVPIGYVFQALGAGAVTLACLAWLAAFRIPPPVPVALLIGFTLLVANLTGAYVSWRLQRSRRVEFLAVREQAEAVRQVRSSESLFRAAFEGVSIGKALGGPDGRFLRVNESLCRFLGCRPPQLLWKTIEDFAVPGDRDDVRAARERVLAGGSPFRGEARFLRPEGGAAWGDLSLSLVREPDGSARYLVCSLVDVDERHRAEQALAASRSRFAELYEGLGDGVVSVRPDGSILTSPRSAGTGRRSGGSPTSSVAATGSRPTRRSTGARTGRSCPSRSGPPPVTTASGWSGCGPRSGTSRSRRRCATSWRSRPGSPRWGRSSPGSPTRSTTRSSRPSRRTGSPSRR
jgi:PAS domain S-box-containing protein